MTVSLLHFYYSTVGYSVSVHVCVCVSGLIKVLLATVHNSKGVMIIILSLANLDRFQTSRSCRQRQ